VEEKEIEKKKKKMVLALLLSVDSCFVITVARLMSEGVTSEGVTQPLSCDCCQLVNLSRLFGCATSFFYD
jgi:hypothetical protein